MRCPCQARHEREVHGLKAPAQAQRWTQPAELTAGCRAHRV